MITRRVKPVARLVREGSTSQAVSQAHWMQRFRGLHISESVAEPSAVGRILVLLVGDFSSPGRLGHVLGQGAGGAGGTPPDESLLVDLDWSRPGGEV